MCGVCVSLKFLKGKVSVSVITWIICFWFFLLQFVVISGGRSVCLPAVWVQWHGLMTISTDGGAVKPFFACVWPPLLLLLEIGINTILWHIIFLNQSNYYNFLYQRHFTATLFPSWTQQESKFHRFKSDVVITGQLDWIASVTTFAVIEKLF